MSEKPETLLNQFWRARKFAAQVTKEEENHPWPTYNTGLSRYQEIFQEVIPDNFLLDFAEMRREKGLSSFVFHPLGGEKILWEMPGIDGGLSLGLVDFPNKKPPFQQNIERVAGDILKGSTWRKIKEFTQRKGIPNGFDLIITSPGSAFGTLGNLEIIWITFNKLWRVLNRNEGEFLIGGFFGEGFLACLLPALEEQKDKFRFRIGKNSFALRLTKDQESPVELPRLKLGP